MSWLLSLGSTTWLMMTEKHHHLLYKSWKKSKALVDTWHTILGRLICPLIICSSFVSLKVKFKIILRTSAATEAHSAQKVLKCTINLGPDWLFTSTYMLKVNCRIELKWTFWEFYVRSKVIQQKVLVLQTLNIALHHNAAKINCCPLLSKIEMVIFTILITLLTNWSWWMVTNLVLFQWNVMDFKKINYCFFLPYLSLRFIHTKYIK